MNHNTFTKHILQYDVLMIVMKSTLSNMLEQNVPGDPSNRDRHYKWSLTTTLPLLGQTDHNHVSKMFPPTAQQKHWTCSVQGSSIQACSVDVVTHALTHPWRERSNRWLIWPYHLFVLYMSVNQCLWFLHHWALKRVFIFVMRGFMHRGPTVKSIDCV